MTFTEKLEKKAAKLTSAPEFQDMVRYEALKALLDSLIDARKARREVIGEAAGTHLEEPPADWESEFEATLLQDVRRIAANVAAVQVRIAAMKEPECEPQLAADTTVLEEQLQQYVSLQHAGFLRLLSKYGKEINTHRFQGFLPRVFGELGFPLPGIPTEDHAAHGDHAGRCEEYLSEAFSHILDDVGDDEPQRKEMLESRELMMAAFREIHGRHGNAELLVAPSPSETRPMHELGISGKYFATWRYALTPPLVQALKGYTRRRLYQDLLAAFIIAVAGVPKAMSYAKLADLPVGLGIATCYAPSIVYSLIGASRQGAISPLSVPCLMLGQMLDEALSGSVLLDTAGTRVELAMLYTFATGIVIAAIGALQLGFLLNFISRSVLSGFMSASALIAVLSTVKSLLGLHLEKSSIVLEIVVRIAKKLSQIHGPTSAIGITGVVYLLGVPALHHWATRRLHRVSCRGVTCLRLYLRFPVVLHVMFAGLLLGGVLCSWHAVGMWTPEHVVVGRGATAPAVFFKYQMKHFDCQFHDEHVTTLYEAIGSAAGLAQLVPAGTVNVDFVASDVPLVDQDLNKRQWHSFPLLLAAICPAVHLPILPSSAPINLILDMPLITDIFLGKVTRWSDVRIQRGNPNLPWDSILADRPIHVVTREAGSGTNEAFVRALRSCKTCDVGQFLQGSPAAWAAPVKSVASSNLDVVALVEATPWSIGYATVADVTSPGVTAARCSALAYDGAIVTPDKSTWPMMLTTYILTPTIDHLGYVSTGHPRKERCVARKILYDFLSYLYDGHEDGAELNGYTVLPRPSDLADLKCREPLEEDEVHEGNVEEPHDVDRRLSSDSQDEAKDLDVEFKCAEKEPTCNSGIEVVGSLGSGSEMPKAKFPRPQIEFTWGDVIRKAFMLAGVAMLEHVATVKLYADRNDYAVDVGGDLVAMGAANCVGALFGSFVVGCGMSRSALNADASSQLSLLVAAFITFAVVCLASSLLAMLPVAVLNVILFCAVLPLIDMKAVVSLCRLGRHGLMDLMALLCAFFATCILGVVNGMMLAIAFSIIEFIRKSVRPQVTTLERSLGSLHYEPSVSRRLPSCWPSSVSPDFQNASAAKVLRFEAPLWFANANVLSDRVLAEVRESNIHGIVLDMSMVPWLDSTAANVVKQLLDRCHEQGVALVFAKANVDVMVVLQMVCGLHGTDFYKSIYTAEVAARGLPERLAVVPVLPAPYVAEVEDSAESLDIPLRLGAAGSAAAATGTGHPHTALAALDGTDGQSPSQRTGGVHKLQL